MPTVEITKELVHLQKALLALVPIMQAAQIGWKDKDQYDSFDTISEALFTAFVIHSLAEGPLASDALAGYKYDFPPYESSNGTKITVTNSDNSGKFIRLATDQSAFDSVIYVSKDGTEFKSPFAGSSFHL